MGTSATSRWERKIIRKMTMLSILQQCKLVLNEMSEQQHIWISFESIWESKFSNHSTIYSFLVHICEQSSLGLWHSCSKIINTTCMYIIDEMKKIWKSNPSTSEVRGFNLLKVHVIYDILKFIRGFNLLKVHVIYDILKFSRT